MTELLRACLGAEAERTAALTSGTPLAVEQPLLRRPTVGPEFSLPLLSWQLDRQDKGAGISKGQDSGLAAAWCEHLYKCGYMQDSSVGV